MDGDSEPYIAEALSTLAMGVTATWTVGKLSRRLRCFIINLSLSRCPKVSAGAHRALSMRQVLRESGEAQPIIDETSAMMLPVISSATLLIMCVSPPFENTTLGFADMATRRSPQYLT
jgi:hypothetical protein